LSSASCCPRPEDFAVVAERIEMAHIRAVGSRVYAYPMLCKWIYCVRVLAANEILKDRVT
jgi:hypothetical protein